MGQQAQGAVGARRVISSRSTFFYKRIFPLIWFGFLAVFVISSLLQPPFDPLFIVMPLFMAIIGWFIAYAITFDLADEVRDAGDALIVRKSGAEERIPLGEIINVDAWWNTPQQPRMLLILRTPCRFGRRITFWPIDDGAFGFSLFQKPTNPLAAELMARANKARQQFGSP